MKYDKNKQLKDEVRYKNFLLMSKHSWVMYLGTVFVLLVFPFIGAFGMFALGNLLGINFGVSLTSALLFFFGSYGLIYPVVECYKDWCKTMGYCNEEYYKIAKEDKDE